MGRRCECPRDGSQYCAWCLALAERAGVRLPGQHPAVPPTLPTAVQSPPPHSPCWPYRSRLEQRYALVLEQWCHDGLLVRWRYEAMRLTLAPRTTLTVDFWLTMPADLPDPRMQLHETKGAWFREDGMVKLKQAAVLYPEYRFFCVSRHEPQWIWKEIPA